MTMAERLAPLLMHLLWRAEEFYWPLEKGDCVVDASYLHFFTLLSLLLRGVLKSPKFRSIYEISNGALWPLHTILRLRTTEPVFWSDLARLQMQGFVEQERT